MHFSIITITKNNAEGFAKTMASVESQIFTDYEWIVIDGDKEPDNGIYDAMNKGIDRANGDFLIFMNAGDEFASPYTLNIIAPYDGADFIYGDSIEGGHIKRAKSYRKIGGGMITHHQAMVYRRDILNSVIVENIGILAEPIRYDETYNLAADYKFTIEFLMRTSRVHYIPQPLCIFEQGGVSQQYAALARNQETQIRDQLGVYAPYTSTRQISAYYLRKYAPWIYLKLRNIVR